jgi:hypothetical protein
LACPNTFEVYETEKIAEAPYERTMYGEISGVVGAHTTLETGIERITWLYNNN